MFSFGELLQGRLDSIGMTLRGFAVKVSNNPGFVSQVISGKRTPPLDRVDDWAEVLALEGEERDAFLRAAYLAHAPAEIADLVDELDLKLAQAQTEILQLREQVVSYEARSPKTKPKRRP